MRGKLIICLFVNIALPHFLFSQGNWELLSPSPTSNQMVGLYFIDDQTGWSVGEYGTILKSTDGGESWSIKEISWTFDLSDIYFPTSQTGYAIGTDGFIIKSTDGGESWEQLQNKYSNNLSRVLFKDEKTGWIIGEKGLLLYTVDGGSNWTLRSSGSKKDLRGIDFIGKDTLCVVGEDETIFLLDIVKDKRSDITFSIDDRFAPYNFEDVYFADNRNGWICGYGNNNYGILIFTENCGLKWEKRTFGDTGFKTWSRTSSGKFDSPIQQIYFYDDLKTGVLLTKDNDGLYGNLLYRSTTQGCTWTGNAEGHNPSFSAEGRFCVLPEGRIIKTGYQGDFNYSTNKGASYFLTNHEKRWWYSTILGENGKCLAIQGIIVSNHITYNFYRSDDRVKTFEQFIPQFYDLYGAKIDINNFKFASQGYRGSYLFIQDTLLCCFMDDSYEESICYSIDFGRNFYVDKKLPKVEGNMERTRFLSREILFRYELDMYDYPGLLLFEYSSDGGKTFEHSAHPDMWNIMTQFGGVRDDCFIDDQTGFMVGSDGNIIKTTDRGQTWTNIYSGVVECLWNIEFINQTTGFVVGDFGRILKTVDGGNSWRKTNSGTQENIYCIYFFNEQEGWVGTENGLRYTKDCGETWQGVPLRYQHGAIKKIQFIGEDGYAYTLPYSNDQNLHLLYMNAGSTNIDEIDVDFTPIETISLFPNYPNPFNSRTTIEYTLPKQADVTLRIFDIQGRLVRSLVNQVQESGPHSAIWDGASDSGSLVSSGVYIYQLECGEQVKRQKLLLLK